VAGLRSPVDTAAARASDPPAWKLWLALWTVYIVWGSTYLAIRVAVETMPPFLHAGVRFLLAGSMMYAFLRLRLGSARVALSLKELGAAAFVGTALLLGGNGLVAVAEQEVPSSLAALIIASVPLWVIVMRVLVGDNVPRGSLLGVVLGFVGLSVLLSPGSAEGVGVGPQLVLVAASLCWATGSFASPRLGLPPDPFLSTAAQMLCGGVALVVAGVLTGEVATVQPERFSTASLVAFAYLVFIGSLAAFTAYTWLLQNAPISKVATYAYVNPVVAVFLGWFFASEALTLPIAVGAIIVVASVALTVRQESAARGPVAPGEAAPVEPAARRS
jgi:drug/metabolite transporter (DMT)-like permease